jgi:hypothetical protein
VAVGGGGRARVSSRLLSGLVDGAAPHGGAGDPTPTSCGAASRRSRARARVAQDGATQGHRGAPERPRHRPAAERRAR